MSHPFHASSLFHSGQQVSSGPQYCPGPQYCIGPQCRRGFMRFGLAGFTSLSLPGILKLQAAAAADSAAGSANRSKTAVIMVWKPGGCSHIDTYDPKP
ncbi:MAG: hypothetical protein KDA89_09075, partial [Planctomycetaceae bacterium]|nr:hypothetical protein [Planctomycetaceae bacterium]